MMCLFKRDKGTAMGSCMEWDRYITLGDMTVYHSLGMLRVSDKLFMNDARFFCESTLEAHAGCFDEYYLYSQMMEDGALQFKVMVHDSLCHHWEEFFQGPLHHCIRPLRCIQRAIRTFLLVRRAKRRVAAMGALSKRLPLDMVMQCLDFL